MQAKFISSIILFAAALVSAVPTQRDASIVPGEVFLCPQNNWGGACQDIVFELGRCQHGASVQVSNSTIASIGPNQKTICLGYTNANCTGNPTWGFAFPGDSTGGADLGNAWGKNLTSLVCYAKQ